MNQPHPLADEWRSRAAKLAAWGAPDVAHAWDAAANELEDYEREHALEALTLTEASKESGYTVDHMSRLVAEGRLENVGHKHAPRVRRGDLPKKPGPPRSKTSDGPD